ncbi:6879_t:CDS:2 [Dentiscutata erythropus]|uniref:6879_t:CDS:1 n=1 Tax=Dentiscutata erythropus TaxID=1348616 RepID=A0A9N8VJD3_9GLOM|nr:6879_t:CDS:2 [Dentiscutata erythropus]
MENTFSIEDAEFIKPLEIDNINSISYSEIKNTELIKIINYGITMKGSLNSHVVIMKHISNESGNLNNEMLKQLYTENGSLHNYLSENQDLDRIQKIKISKDIAFGLEFLHNLGMIHRNLNTKSIFININKGKVLISNPAFLELNIDVSSSISLQAGMIAFTDPMHLIDLNSKPTTASDIYSFGVVMWSISSGKLPFENITNQTDLINQIVTEDIRENPVNGIPQEYLDLYLRCWKLNPEERPSAQDVYTQLEAILQKETRNVDANVISNNPDVTNAIVQNNEVPVNTLNQNREENGQLPEKRSGQSLVKRRGQSPKERIAWIKKKIKAKEIDSIKRSKVKEVELLMLGGYGVVYKAEWNNNNVALKYMPPYPDRPEQEHKVLLKEASSIG